MWRIVISLPVIVLGVFQLGKWSHKRELKNCKNELCKSIHMLESVKCDDANWTRGQECILLETRNILQELEEVPF